MRFPAGRLTAAAVAYRRNGGLSAADRRTVAAEAAGLRSATGVQTVDAPVFSRDGTSALVIARVRPERRGSIDSVKAIRKLVGHGSGGLAVAVTGPAGFSADAADVFGSIDATLFLATLGLVLVLLIVIYRSPVFWVMPMVSVVFAVIVARGLAYLLGKQGVTITGQAGGIMTVLVFGVGTDYALLLVARFREALGREPDKHRAAAEAVRRAGPAIVPSSLTVIAALLCLELADVRSTAGLGAIGAAGVAVAMLAMLTLLPALLSIFGRRAFWPFVPQAGADAAEASGGVWARIAERVAANPRRVWALSLLVLAVMAAGLLDLNSSLTSANGFRKHVDAVAGQRLVAKAFPLGASAPAYVIVKGEGRVQAVRAARPRSRTTPTARPGSRTSGGCARWPGGPAGRQRSWAAPRPLSRTCGRSRPGTTG